MADNLTAPATGAVLATDEIAGAHYPRTKVSFGTDGNAVDVSATNPFPVSGNFYPATQIVSAAALPLPAGASTSAKQDTNTAAVSKLGSAKRWFAIAPSDTVNLATTPDALYVGGAGNVVLRGSDGVNATFAVAAGQILPLSPTRVLATDTTATGLIGLIS